MTKVRYKKIIYLALVIIWMLIVFIFSSENGEKSEQTSTRITKAIVQILTYNQELSETEMSSLIEKADLIVRKLAHFSIYALGGILIYNYISTFNLKARQAMGFAFVLGAIYAASDESHQYFVSDRNAQILDVCIDSLGIITGIILTYIVKKIKTKKPLYN